MDENGVQA